MVMELTMGTELSWDGIVTQSTELQDSEVFYGCFFGTVQATVGNARRLSEAHFTFCFLWKF